MQRLIEHFTIHLDPCLYVKDPMLTDIGKAILHHSVLQISKSGMESFTIKKLAAEVETTETTIYRYFSNKHQLLMYLCSWYWMELQWKIAFGLANIDNPHKQLSKACEALAEPVKASKTFVIDEEHLQRLVCNNFGKTHDVHFKNEFAPAGYYHAYHDLIERLSKIILACKKNYPYPQGLAQTLVESSMRQLFYRYNFPKMSDAQSISQLPAFLQTLTASLH